MEWFLMTLSVLSTMLCVWQWIAGCRFALGRTTAPDGAVPPVSVLKPLKGMDTETESCLRSWFEQEYQNEVELLFGVADEHDPVCQIVRKLAPLFPERRSRLVIAHPILGPNGKVSSLCYLARAARHEHLVISDDDVEIRPGFLAALVPPLLHGKALVHSFYILRPFNLPMALEAVGVNADFWTQVLQGRSINRTDFALGAAMATTKTELRRIGGFEALLDFLADDYQLGNRIAKAGGKIDLCPVPVTCWMQEQSWPRVWHHQLRWARTIRFCAPWSYFFSILGNGTLWPLLAWAAFPAWRIALVAQVGILVRALTARANYRRLTGDNGWLAFGLAPIKDLLGALVWALSFFGNTVTWRGVRYRVTSGGKLTPLA